VTVGVSSSGQVSLFNAYGSTDVVVDVEGYVAADPTATSGLYNALNPYRICDTRTGNPSGLAGSDGQCLGNTLAAGGTLTIQVTGTNPTGTTSGGVPSSGVSAVVLNVTVTGPTAASYLTVWPAGASQPVASNLNFVAGQTVSNRVIVPVSSSGQVSIYNGYGTADVVVDVNGWFTDGSSASQSGSYFTGVTPSRICDTRPNNPSGLSGPAAQCNGTANAGTTLGPGATVTINVAGLADLPAQSSDMAPVAVILNLAVTDTTGPAYLTAWPTGAAQPVASDLNWLPGQTVPNLVEVSLGSGGQVSIFNSAGNTDVVVDVLGYESGGDYVPPSTKVLNASSLSMVSTVAPDESTVAFSGTNSQLSSLVPGAVINAPPDAQFPYGLLRKVTGVTSLGGTTTVTTQAAKVSDAVEQGALNFSAAPTNYATGIGASAPASGPAGTVAPHASAASGPGVIKSTPIQCGGSGSVGLNANVTDFSVTPSFNAAWSPLFTFY